MEKTSVLIPIYNDAEVIGLLFARLKPVLRDLNDDFEIIFIDDGSKDDSLETLLQLQQTESEIKIIKLVRNYGQPGAIAAGLDNSTGDIIIIMDSDLQDRPEDIPALIKAVEENNVLMAIARKYQPARTLREHAARWFFVLSNKITSIHHDPDLRVFRALKREALKILENFPVKKGTILSLLYRAGVPYTTVDLTREERCAGKTGYDLLKLIKMAFNRVIDHSILCRLTRNLNQPGSRYQIDWIFEEGQDND